MYHDVSGTRLESRTVGGESPVERKVMILTEIDPSSIGHEESGVNQRGPNHVRLNTLVDR